MKPIRHIAIAVAALAAAIGCTDESATEAEQAIERPASSLERARGVEDDVLEAAERQRERIDEQGG
jgi:hypothetical protein